MYQPYRGERQKGLEIPRILANFARMSALVEPAILEGSAAKHFPESISEVRLVKETALRCDLSDRHGGNRQPSLCYC